MNSLQKIRNTEYPRNVLLWMPNLSYRWNLSFKTRDQPEMTSYKNLGINCWNFVKVPQNIDFDYQDINIYLPGRDFMFNENLFYLSCVEFEKIHKVNLVKKTYIGNTDNLVKKSSTSNNSYLEFSRGYQKKHPLSIN